MERLRTADGIDLAYRVRGPHQVRPSSSHTVWRWTIACWKPQVDAVSTATASLSTTSEVTASACAPDQFTPRAAANDLIALLDHVEAPTAAFIGHSLGEHQPDRSLEHRKRVSAFVGLGCACITMKPIGHGAGVLSRRGSRRAHDGTGADA